MAEARAPFYRDGHSTIHHGDTLAILPSIDEIVDVVIADPPYSSGGRTSSERTGRSTRAKYVSTDATHSLPDFAGDTRDQRAHGYWCSLWLGAALRTTRAGGLCFVFTDWRQLAETIDSLQAGGWVWRGIVAWRKRGGRPQRGRFKYDVEYVVWGSNGDLPVHQSVYPSSVVDAAAPRDREHITQKPLEVYDHLLSIAPERSTVLDPFLGSGSAAVAARAAGHRVIGIEISKHYCQVSARRLAELASLDSAITT